VTDVATSTDLIIACYDADAKPFFAATVDVDMSPLYAPFLAKLAPGAAILDTGSGSGSGSGRDARAFREQGYAVTAIEPSPLAGAPGRDTRQRARADADGTLDHG